MSVAGNYAENAVPGANDVVLLNNVNNHGGPGFFTPIADAALGASINSVQFTFGYSGTLEVARNLTISQISMSGFNSQTITIDAGQTLSSGSINMSGDTITGAGELDVVSGNMTAGASGSTLSVATMRIDNASSMTMNGNVTLNGVNLTNLGGITWATGNILVMGTPTVTNAGTFTVTGQNHDFASGATFTNNGIFNVSQQGTSYVVDFRSTLNNLKGNLNAQVNISVGDLALWGTDSSTSDILIAGGGMLGSTSTLSIMGGGTLNALNGSTISGQGTVVVQGTIAAAANTTLTIAPAVTLSSAGGFFGTLSGPGLFSIAGTLTCNDGIINTGTTVTVANTVTFTAGAPGGDSLNMTDSTLQCNGGIWSSGQIMMSNSTLRNIGVFNISSNAGMNATNADLTSVFTNASTGTVNFSSANFFNVLISDFGAMNLSGQTINFRKGVTQTNGTITLGGGTITLLNGDYFLSGGTLVADGTISGRNVSVLGGTLELKSVFTLTGNLTLTAAGTLQVDASNVAYGQANVSGQVILGGSLTVSLASGYVPAQGTKRTILTAGAGQNQGFVGAFATLPAGWQVNSPNGTTRELEKQ